MFTISTCGPKLPRSNFKNVFYEQRHTQTCTCRSRLKETFAKHDICAFVLMDTAEPFPSVAVLAASPRPDPTASTSHSKHPASANGAGA